MSFHDLPDSWSKTPITESNLCDVFDLFVSFEDRVRGSIILLVLDEFDRIRQPIVIGDVPHDAGEPPWIFLDQLSDLMDRVGGTVLFARGRMGPALLSAADLRWQQWIAETFGDRLRGCYLATEDEVTAYENCGFDADLAS
ncbi:hypothetical protein [Yimella sp. cx-51]|uniref:hypothetical protein n=1 Tax=Yimella sp. cx-51 TaxID=2770551 RepID=UPI00165E2C9C|nr:hypothetical protein [Yimella sp. cx-51]MBC9957542.1 hypothetical protein [Yimella sp. cx-51]MBD2760782.1 hypothetical protein [Yimella sp. cx-573]QTH39234.1 hypothetical protein J5M86_06420 [Yimella sp. cx-51]